MQIKLPDIIKETARKLRKNMTISEKILWKYLRYDKIGVRFYRQKPIYLYTENNGLDRYIIPDFYCHDKKLIIEVDGGIHNIPEVLELDKSKEELLFNIGIKIIRITNYDIQNNLESVLLQIKSKLK